MRTEKEILDLVLSVAQQDERIRIVGMNGSRTNPKAQKDIFQDYDIVYLVTDLESFRQDKKWIDVFGERMILQTPEDMELFPPTLGGRFTYLMQFTDGTRIDLMLIPLEEYEQYSREDSLTKILLDKDGLIPPLPPANDSSYHVRRPTPGEFKDCCNEFWWVAPYVAKGLWRQELLYASEHLLNNVKSQLIRMLSWQVGAENNFCVSTGKCGKYLNQYLPADLFKKLISCLDASSSPACWRSLFLMCELFGNAARSTADLLGYLYDQGEEDRVTSFLHHIQTLPHNASEIY